MKRQQHITETTADQAVEPHAFDQTNGSVDLGTIEFREVEDPRNFKRRESSEQAMAFLWGGKY